MRIYSKYILLILSLVVGFSQAASAQDVFWVAPHSNVSQVGSVDGQCQISAFLGFMT